MDLMTVKTDQIEYYNEVIELKNKYPDYEIKLLVSTDNFDDDFKSLEHIINSVGLAPYYIDKDNEIYTDINSYIEDQATFEDIEISEEEAGKLFKPVILIETRM